MLRSVIGLSPTSLLLARMTVVKENIYKL